MKAKLSTALSDLSLGVDLSRWGWLALAFDEDDEPWRAKFPPVVSVDDGVAISRPEILVGPGLAGACWEDDAWLKFAPRSYRGKCGFQGWLVDGFEVPGTPAGDEERGWLERKLTELRPKSAIWPGRPALGVELVEVAVA